MKFPADELSFEVGKVAMLKAYPGLKVVEGYNGLVTAAKNIRTELKAAFPGVKFTVRTKSYTGGDSINVGWVDGPLAKDVDAIVNKYKAGSFDGMTDSYTYETTPFTAVFGDAGYIFTNREYSDAAELEAIDAVYAKYKGNFERGGVAKPALEDFNRGRCWNVQLPGIHFAGAYDRNVQQMINQQLAETDYTAMQKEEKVAA